MSVRIEEAEVGHVGGCGAGGRGSRQASPADVEGARPRGRDCAEGGWSWRPIRAHSATGPKTLPPSRRISSSRSVAPSRPEGEDGGFAAELVLASELRLQRRRARGSDGGSEAEPELRLDRAPRAAALLHEIERHTSQARRRRARRVGAAPERRLDEDALDDELTPCDVVEVHGGHLRVEPAASNIVFMFAPASVAVRARVKRLGNPGRNCRLRRARRAGPLVRVAERLLERLGKLPSSSRAREHEPHPLGVEGRPALRIPAGESLPGFCSRRLEGASLSSARSGSPCQALPERGRNAPSASRRATSASDHSTGCASARCCSDGVAKPLVDRGQDQRASVRFRSSRSSARAEGERSSTALVEPGLQGKNDERRPGVHRVAGAEEVAGGAALPLGLREVRTQARVPDLSLVHREQVDRPRGVVVREEVEVPALAWKPSCGIGRSLT